jgi:hypothetical protein
LRGKLHGARQNGEGVFFADTVKSGDSLQHGTSPQNRAALEPNRARNANVPDLVLFTRIFNDLLVMRDTAFAVGRGILRLLATG